MFNIITNFINNPKAHLNFTPPGIGQRISCRMAQYHDNTIKNHFDSHTLAIIAQRSQNHPYSGHRPCRSQNLKRRYHHNKIILFGRETVYNRILETVLLHNTVNCDGVIFVPGRVYNIRSYPWLFPLILHYVCFIV